MTQFVMKTIVDTDGNEYENEEVFLSHVLEVVGEHLKKFEEYGLVGMEGRVVLVGYRNDDTTGSWRHLGICF